MKITALKTYRVDEFANVLWVHVETDAGITGLGETFYGAEAVEAHIHNTLAVRLVGQNPLNIEALHKEMVSLPNAQASTGWNIARPPRLISRCGICSGKSATSPFM